MRCVSVGSTVYARADGIVAFLDVPEGVMPPPGIADLVLLGPAYDVITTVVNFLRDRQIARGHSPCAQQILANTLNTCQQNISRWMNARSAPRLNDEQWARLIRLYASAQQAERATWGKRD